MFSIDKDDKERIEQVLWKVDGSALNQLELHLAIQLDFVNCQLHPVKIKVIKIFG